MSELTRLLQAAIGATMRADLAGPQYAIVTEYQPPPIDRARVRPVLAMVDPMGVPMPPPELGPLPVEWPRSAGGSITWPLAPGDPVRLVPLDADHLRWLLTGAVGVPPQSAMKWDLALSVIHPLAPSTSAGPLPTDAYSALGPVIRAAHVFLGSAAAADFLALASKVDLEIGRIWTVLTVPHAHPLGTGTFVFVDTGHQPTGSTKLHGE